MLMNDIARKRLSDNFKQSIRYLSLVFNDFFVLALIFLFGALMFWYAQAMKTMKTGLWYYPLVLAIFLWLPMLTGKLVTLIKEGDKQFLFTQDDNMEKYLSPMRKYSMILPTLLIALMGGILFPFATIKTNIAVYNYCFLLVGLVGYKYCELLIAGQNLTFDKKAGTKFWQLNFYILLLLIVFCYFDLVSIILPIIDIILVLLINNFKKQRNVFDWQGAIDTENNRKQTVYSIFSMFTDVAERKVNVRRRKYLDFLLPKSLVKESPNSFLYRRSLLRNPEYLNLLVRMTVFAILLAWVVQNSYWTLGLTAIVMYLTVWQLLPLGHLYDRNVMYHVYPINVANRSNDLRKVLSGALFLQFIIISISWLVLLKENKAMVIGILLCWTALLIYGYLPVKTKQEDKKLRYRKVKR